MNTFQNSPAATDASIDGEFVMIRLNNGKTAKVAISDHAFLVAASREQRRNLQIEPHGFAIYWPDLDDGFEIAHILEQINARSRENNESLF